MNVNFIRLHIIFAALVATILMGCSGAELMKELGDPTRIGNVSVNAKFCADPVAAPKATDFKPILFFDASQSMFNNDPIYNDPITNEPTNRRVEATKQFEEKVEEACESGFSNISVAFASFGSGTTVHTNPDFEPCGISESAYTAFLAQVGGPTNFFDAVVFLKQFLREDIDSYPNPAEKEVVYYIILGSDGRPDDGTPGVSFEETNEAILGKWKELVSMVNLYDWVHLKVDTYLFKGAELSSGTPQAIQLLNEQRELLTGFNLEAPGRYFEVETTTLTSGEFEFEFPSLYSLFSPIHINEVLAINRSVGLDFSRSDVVSFRIDSDEDGLPDSREIEIGSNPSQVDTDLDGCSDFVEDLLGLDLLDNTDCPLTEEELEDSDGDGARDGTEVILGTNPFDPDSDNDGIPDFDEIKNNLNPNNETDQSGDLDTDGMTNKEEFVIGFDMRNSNPEEAPAFAIDYSIKQGPIQPDGSYCADILINNIVVEDTLDAENVVDILILFDDNLSNHGIAKHQFTLDVMDGRIQGASRIEIGEDEWTIY
jgi:hypothetical protein